MFSRFDNILKTVVLTYELCRIMVNVYSSELSTESIITPKLLRTKQQLHRFRCKKLSIVHDCTEGL